MTRAMNVAAESTEPSLILSRPSTRSAAAMLLFASLAFASPIAAQDGTGEKDLLAELQACRSIAVPAERLACFDRASATLVEARDSGEVRLVDREEIQQTQRGLFGFTLPKLDIFGSGNDDEIDMLESTITGVSRYGRNGYRIKIEEGSVWQIDSAPSRLRMPRPGDEIVLKKASLGSFFIRIAGQIGVKGKRVE